MAPVLSTAKQISGFIGCYTPEIAKAIIACRKQMRSIVPKGFEMVYDNYAGLVFGYSPSEKPSEALLSIAAYPDHVTLCFLQGARLADPDRLLKGSGNQVRSMRLRSPKDLSLPAVERLIERALAPQREAFARAPRLTTIIRSISAKQRPRRPPEITS